MSDPACFQYALDEEDYPRHPNLWKGGAKYDQGKADWSLLPWDALESVVDVMMFGCLKYGPDQWRDVPDAGRRYWSAAQRHLISHLQGEASDDESGLPHLAHAACCVLFLLALDQTGEQR